ncbi:MAG TPA: OsmC family protein [Acidimicrobiales bacterium]|nr:OsmC family protein [Acidimicrobiales bacterium]
MDREQLKATQAPLKAQYRDDPATALITLHADGRLGEEDVSCSVATGRAMVEAGLHPASGGDGSLACSGDMLLQALVACAGVTLRSVAINRGLVVEGSLRAEGDLDFRGTLGVERDAPVGFTDIRLQFNLTTPSSPEEVADLISTTERYCVVLQTLAGTPRITVHSEVGSP